MGDSNGLGVLVFNILKFRLNTLHTRSTGVGKLLKALAPQCYGIQRRQYSSNRLLNLIGHFVF